MARLLDFGRTIPDGQTAFVDENLPENSFLTHATLGYDVSADAPPLRMIVSLGLGNNRMFLVGGWVRSDASVYSADLVWDGRIQLTRDAYLRLTASNTTGAAQEARCFYTLEDPLEVPPEVEK